MDEGSRLVVEVSDVWRAEQVVVVVVVVMVGLLGEAAATPGEY